MVTRVAQHNSCINRRPNFYYTITAMVSLQPPVWLPIGEENDQGKRNPLTRRTGPSFHYVDYLNPHVSRVQVRTILED